MPTIVTTSEYWSVLGPDGVDHPLSTPAYNIDTWGDDRQKPPAFRGDNPIVPLVPGASWVSKVADQKTITLAGWVIGESDSGLNIPSAQKKQKFHDNWTNLRSWLAQAGQFTVTKRWTDTTGTFRTATAQAEFAGGLAPAAFSPSGARFTVDLRLADPYFYGTAVAVAFDTSVTGTYHPTILGDALCRKITMSAASKPTTNTLTNPRIDVSTTSPACYWYLNEVVPVSTALVIDFGQQAAAVGANNHGLFVVHAGFTDWLILNPGASTIVFSSGANNWSGTLTYVPTYF